MTHSLTALILAGGFGTRLKGALTDLPKPLAPIAGKPFLVYMLEQLEQSALFNRAILLTHYQSNKIISALGDRYKSMKLDYIEEKTPLGTGGAIKQAMTRLKQNCVFVLNGDTIFNIDLAQMLELHQQTNADITIACRRITDATRFGTLEVHGSRIVGFAEKQQKTDGFINAGIYLLNTSIRAQFPAQTTFSIENDFFPNATKDLVISAYKSDAFFIDIGIPEDYQKAQSLIPQQIEHSGGERL